MTFTYMRWEDGGVVCARIIGFDVRAVRVCPRKIRTLTLIRIPSRAEMLGSPSEMSTKHAFQENLLSLIYVDNRTANRHR